jgi:hypothetical protein
MKSLMATWAGTDNIGHSPTSLLAAKYVWPDSRLRHELMRLPAGQYEKPSTNLLASTTGGALRAVGVRDPRLHFVVAPKQWL